MFQLFALRDVRLQTCRLYAYLRQLITCYDLTAHKHRLQGRHTDRVAILEERQGVIQSQRRTVVTVQRRQQIAHRGILDIVYPHIDDGMQRMKTKRRSLNLGEVLGTHLVLHFLRTLDTQLGLAQIGIIPPRQVQTRVDR